jgi:intracellular multiplication protein IcmV
MSNRKFGIFVRPIRDMRYWVGFDHLRYTARMITSLMGGLISRPKITEHFETFEQVKKRYKLTENDLKTRQKALFQFFMIYFSFALAMLAYASYGFVHGYYAMGISSVSLTCMLLSFAFREHFWYTQIKNRRLGLTFKMWWNLTFSRRS